MRLELILSSFAVLSVVACGSPDAGPAGAGTDVSDVPSLALIEELRLGGLEAPLELQFPRVSSVKARPNGTIYVLERSESTIRLFGPDGSYVGSIEGRIQVDDRAYLHHFEHPHVYGVDRDELDVTYVVRWRIGEAR